MQNQVGRLYVLFDADGRPYIKGLKEIDQQTGRAGAKMQSDWTKYGKAAGMAVAGGMVVAAAAIGKIGTVTVKAAASFEYEMSRIKANANGTAAEMQKLQATVIQLGKDTVFSAGETAQAANELVKAGLSVADTISALPGMLALASAGELDVAQAAEITANQLNVFGLAASDAMSIADTLALAANRSTTEVGALGLSLSMSATVAAQAGLTFQETAAGLALLANNGLKGSDAGTSLKSMFMQLMAPSKKARDLMEEYSISAYDASGNMLDMADIIENVSAGLEGLTPQERDFAVATIFGSDAMRTANILLKEGAGAYRDMTKEVSQAGAAQDIAATKMDNLKGSWEQLKGSAETMAIQLGTKVIPVIRDFVDDMTGVLNDAIETGDWSKMGEEVGQLIGEGIEAATPYAVDAAKAMAAAIASAVGLLPGEGPTEGEVVDALMGVDAEAIKKYAQDKSLELADAYLAGIGQIRHLIVATGKYENVTPQQASDIAKQLGLYFDEAQIRAAVEAGLDENVAARLLADQQQKIKDAAQVALSNAKAPYKLTSVSDLLGIDSAYSPGSGLWAAEFVGVADAASDAADSIGQVGDAADTTADSTEALTEATKTLTSLYASEVSPSSVWEKADGSLKTYLADLQKQIDNWANFEKNLQTLATKFGPEYGADVIEKAAELGPDFVAALVGAKDPATVKKAFTQLDTIMDQNQADLAKKVEDWCAPAGEAGGTVMGESVATTAQDYLDTHILDPSTFGSASMKSEGEAAAKSFKGGMDSWLSSHKLQLQGLGFFPSLSPAGGASAEELLKSFGVGAGLIGGKMGGLAGSTASVWNTLHGLFPNSTWMGGYATSGHVKNSDHYTHHAFDTGGSKATMQAMANALAANFDSWGLKYIIYNRKINKGGGWVSYKGANPHTDHVHVSTYDMGGWIGQGILPSPQRSTGRPIPILAHEGEYVLTENQARALAGYATGGYVGTGAVVSDALDKQIHDLIVQLRKNLGDGSIQDAIADAFSERASVQESYISREAARYGMYEAQDAPIELLESTLMRKIELIDAAIAEATVQLQRAKVHKLPQEEINQLAANLFSLEQQAAEAADELEALARVPLERAADSWSNSIGQLNTLMDLVGNSSNALALQMQLLPSLMGSLGGNYQTSLDLMNSSTNPDDIMGYATDAISGLNSMFGTEQSIINRSLSDRLASIDSAESAWESSWDAQADALDASIQRQSEALDKQLEDLQESQDAQLEALNDFYDDKIQVLQDGETAITREQQRNAGIKTLGGLEDELRILQGQGYYTEADISRMHELETQIQEQHDSMAQQEEAWARADEITRLQREKEEQVASLQQQQEAALESLQAQIESQKQALESQRQAFEQQQETQRQNYERQREQARQAAQNEIDTLVTKYQTMMQEVINRQNELLGQASIYNNAGYTLGVEFANGLLASLPAITAAANTIAAQVASILELHSDAEMGPFSNLSTWWDAFIPTLVKPLDTYGPGGTATNIAASVQSAVTSISRNEERVDIYLHNEVSDNNMAALADIVEDRVRHKIEVRGRER